MEGDKGTVQKLIVESVEQIEVITQGDGTLILRERQEVFYNASLSEEERLVSELCVDLLEHYRYPLRLIETRQMVRVDELDYGKRYAEADVLVRGEKGSRSLLFEVVPSSEYESCWEESLRKLFALGAALTKEALNPLWLVYYTSWRENNARIIRIFAIEPHGFPSFKAWDAAGRPHTMSFPKADK